MTSSLESSSRFIC